MLAYVFWHWRRQAMTREEYEDRQRRFHAALQAAPPPGFLGSRSVAIRGAPWAASGGEAYEDWYLVNDSAALDPLNQAAVTAPRQLAHDAAASAAESGTAGLYRLRRGSAGDAVPAHAAWFGKSAGMSYDQLFSTLQRLLPSAAGALWCRQMVLGPTPEFCLQSAVPVTLPPPFAPLVLELRPVWPPLASVSTGR
ncbi:MAG TPA: hypothetical protein VH763_15795 [Gemmatimonadales bacterium]|jgi:hypothetical protein